MSAKKVDDKAAVCAANKAAAAKTAPTKKPEKQKKSSTTDKSTKRTPKKANKDAPKTGKTNISANSQQRNANKTTNSHKRAKKKVKVFEPHPVYQYEPMQKPKVTFSSIILITLLLALLAYLLCAPVYSFSYRQDTSSEIITTETDVPMYRLIIRVVTDLWRPREQRIIEFSLGPIPESTN